MKTWIFCPLLLSAGLLAVVSPALAVPVVGMMDDFEDGTTQGWALDPFDPFSPVPPANQATGGPGGAGDSVLSITALGGGGPGRALNATNALQWSGNYIAAGVDAITMDVRNVGPTDLYLRLAFLELSSAGLVNSAYSDTPVVLSTGGAWTHVAFGFSDLVALDGTVAGALSNTTHLQIIHSPIEPVSFIFPYAELALLNVDNITASGPGPGPGGGNEGGGASVPDTGSSAGLLSLALVGLVLLKRKSR